MLEAGLVVVVVVVGEIQPAELAHPGRDNKVADHSPGDLSTA